MEKLFHTAGKVAERIGIQPKLTTAADSLELQAAHRDVLDFYFNHRADPVVAKDDIVPGEMARMAIRAQVELAKFYANEQKADSVLAAYRRIGREIPAGPEDIAGATMALALTFKAINLFDSSIYFYDKLLAEYYPPTDSLQRVNTDIISIPIDKIKISRAIADTAMFEIFTKDALDYYGRLKSEFPNSLLARTATIYTGRVYAITRQWDEALDQLNQIKDSTGVIDIQALVLKANIYNGPLNDEGKSIELYQEILARDPDSSIIGSTLLRLGAALCSQEQFEEGRRVLVDLKEAFARYPFLTSKAQLYYAQSFEAQNRWDRALSEFQWLMENHPYTEEAFRAALHIPEYFTRENDQKLADIWYDRAIDFFNRAIVNQQGRPVVIAAYTFLSDTYRRTEQWPEAMKTLDQIYSLTPTSRIGAKALYNAARVAYLELGDSTLSQSYLDRLYKEFGTADSAAINKEEEVDINLEEIQ